jgi:hypothetical protein
MKYSFLFSICFISSGCSLESNLGCKPVLQVYTEYGAKADPKNLPGTYASKPGTQNAAYFGLNFEIPEGWHAEQIHRFVVRVYDTDWCQSFLIVFNQGDVLTKNIRKPELIGCRDFAEKDLARFKSDKDYYRDLYLFTSDQLDERPRYWQYWILWSKSREFQTISALYHYTGRSLEAFQKNTDALTRLSKEKGTRIEVVVFPAKIAPDYLTIIAEDLDDGFIADFLDMLNTLNP